jgi:hypothetical protein
MLKAEKEEARRSCLSVSGFQYFSLYFPSGARMSGVGLLPSLESGRDWAVGSKTDFSETRRRGARGVKR